MSGKKIKRLVLDLLLFIVLVALDQGTKYLAVLHLKDHAPVPIIDGVFELHYLENRGAAFGMLQNQKVFFIFIAVVILAAICYVLFRMPDKKRYRSMNFFCVLIASGAVGNMIDRFRCDYVVDFLYFVLIRFPIFNVADIYVTCATILLAIFLLFVYKDEELRFLSVRPKKYREVKNEPVKKDKEQG
ncbi:MAG: signal peptidase II [Lachnospiraceae bacterium]|nr:signal peptidase II [Lachnospiraceae bacterium]